MKLGAVLVKNKELAKCDKMRKIVLYIVEQLKNIDIEKKRLDPEFITFVCEIIENQIINKNKKKSDQVDKMDLFVDVMKEIRSTEEQINQAQVQVEYYLRQGMIKKTSFKSMAWFFIKKYFLKLIMLD